MKRNEAVTGSQNTNGPGSDASSDVETKRALEQGDKEKIDQMLDELNVSTTESGKDQTSKPDTEGSNSSSKNLDEQSD
ncbi:hypothetical protein BZM27_28970 [Paraburkholderia steynii]|uniref:Uncharacterized protein n=1 Tax=Paraburkholderia steynii TaxID=1245441 RepID=A0A4R0X768_9BURK|nr:hypothetical protein BZM27_28970 [Paraburkholderia steynii]